MPAALTELPWNVQLVGDPPPKRLVAKRVDVVQAGMPVGLSGAGSGTWDAASCGAGAVLRDAPAGAHPGGEGYRAPVACTPDLVSA